MARLHQLSFLLTFIFSVFSIGALAAEDGESILISEVGRMNNQSLLWGPYRPNLYFGIRPRLPQSLMTGLMWGKIETYTDFQNSKCSLADAGCWDGGC
jgi:mannosyl-oligosaccharide glucosidase